MCCCEKDNKVILTDFKIVRLQYEAQGFRNSFFVMCNSLFHKENCEGWNQNGDAMSVIGTLGCFAIELYLKFLMVIATFSSANLSGYHMRKHSLDCLYKDLKKVNPNMVREIEKNYAASAYCKEHKSFKKFLSSIKDYFIEWRYSYDCGKLNVNLNTVSDLLNILEHVSSNYFLKISFYFSKIKHKQNSSDEQTLSISNFDDIKRND